MEIQNNKYTLRGAQNIVHNKDVLKVEKNRPYVVLKTMYAGICTSDVKTYINGVGKYFGHEMVCKVESTNSNEFQVGEYIVPLHTNPVNYHMISIGFQEYSALYEPDFGNLVKVLADCPFNYVFLDTVCCVVHAINKIKSLFNVNTQILLLGSGFISVLFQKFLHLNNVEYHISERNAIIKDQNFDICIDTTGSTEFINAHLDLVNLSGRLILFSNTTFGDVNFTYIREKDIDVYFPKYFSLDEIEFSIECLKKMDMQNIFKIYDGLSNLENVLQGTHEKDIMRGILKV